MKSVTSLFYFHCTWGILAVGQFITPNNPGNQKTPAFLRVIPQKKTWTPKRWTRFTKKTHFSSNVKCSCQNKSNYNILQYYNDYCYIYKYIYWYSKIPMILWLLCNIRMTHTLTSPWLISSLSKSQGLQSHHGILPVLFGQLPLLASQLRISKKWTLRCFHDWSRNNRFDQFDHQVLGY